MRLTLSLALTSTALLGAPPQQDPFVTAIQKMKHSLGSIVCIQVQGTESTILDYTGSAFFVSRAGGFVTAAHVVDSLRQAGHPCPQASILVPQGDWRPDARKETLRTFDFEIANCRIDAELDIARCHTAVEGDFEPVKFDRDDILDGTQVAFIGFPMASRDPMTSRGGVAAHRNQLLLIDQPAWPGMSGSPVFTSDGCVIGVVVARGVGDGAGMSMVRPASQFKKVLE